MKHSNAAAHTSFSRHFRFRSFFVCFVVLLLAVFTLFQTSERVAKADRSMETVAYFTNSQPDRESQSNDATPLSAILNIDGTIRKGSIGSFDPKGFQMSYGPKGEPRFLPVDGANDQRPEGSCSDGWDDRFPIPGTNGVVSASVIDAGGNLYVGGGFTAAGNVFANQIAKWDGTSWSPLGTGMNGNVFALAVSGTDVYAGGSFLTAGGVAVNRIAKWDGTSWSPLGTGMNSTVWALAVSGTDVYAGGAFTTAGGVSANYIAEWDGTSWSALGTGMNNGVRALAVSGTDIYAGGGFTTAGGVSANRIAKWDRTNWSALGTGLSGGVLGVFALAVSGTDVYAGGDFTGRIRKWNGTSWSTLGIGVGGSVNALAVSGTDVYAGGDFTTAGGVSAINIAKWDGTSWSALGTGVNNDVFALALSGTDVYAGGIFFTSGGVSFYGIEKWNGTGWSGIATGMNDVVYALAISGTNVYAGGYFTTAGGVSANKIARWDGTNWSALGTGLGTGIFDLVRALAVSGTDVYAGGSFTTAGGVSVSSIAKWDGTSWSALGTGMSGRVDALAVSGTDVYAGGDFTTAGGVSADRIAKWDGTNWSALGTGMNNSVQALAVSGTDVYAGGQFNTAGGVAVNRIAKWDGTNWSALDTGVSGTVYALGVSGTDVYAGGEFTIAGCHVSGYFGHYNAPSPSVSGVLTYGNAVGAPIPRFVSGVLLSGAGSLPVSASSSFPNGTYTLSGFGSGAYTVTPSKTGGVNGAISSFDAGKIAQHAAGINILTGNQLIVADVSGNGTVSSFDAGQIALYVVNGSGMQTGTWKFIPVNRTYASVSGNIAGEDFIALLMGEVSGNWMNTGARPVDSAATPLYLRRNSASPVLANQDSVARQAAAEPQNSNWRSTEKHSFSANRTAELWMSAGPESAVSVELSTLVASLDKEIVVPISVQGVADKEVISYEFDLRYDPTVIQPFGDVADLEGSVSRHLKVVTNPNEPGLLRVVVYGPMPIDENGLLLNLRFTSVGGSGASSPLTFERIMFNEGEPRVTVTDGKIELF